MNEWMKKVGDILCPIAQDDDFSRGNAINLIGKIEEKIGVKKEDRYKNMKNQSPTKQVQGPVIEVEEHSQKYNELLSYDNMKEYAKTYIRSKRS